MEVQLELGLSLIKQGTQVRYITEVDKDIEMRDGDVCLDKQKIKGCPDEGFVMEAIQKKINRSDILRSKSNTLGVCILLLVSKGYRVNSSVLVETTDQFVEKCWECLGVAADNVPVNISYWIRQCMESRSHSSYSTLYCKSRRPGGTADFLSARITKGKGKGERVEHSLVPTSIWNRDDAVYQTMIEHYLLGNGDLTNN